MYTNGAHEWPQSARTPPTHEFLSSVTLSGPTRINSLYSSIRYYLHIPLFIAGSLNALIDGLVAGLDWDESNMINSALIN